MRVCLAYDCLFPWTIGGAERWMRNLAEALAADGHDVTYLTRRQWAAGDPPSIPGVRVHAVSRAEPLYGPDGSRTIGEPLRFGAGVLRHLVGHGGAYDVVHTASFPYFNVLAAACARRRHGYRLIVDWHEVWSDDYWDRYLGRLRGAAGRAVQGACVRTTHEAFCFSELHARRLVAGGLDGTPTILRGQWPGTASPSRVPTPAAPLVVFAGRMIPEKRAPAVVAAVAAARRRLPGLRATLFGDGPQLHAVRAAIAEQRAGDFVSAPGFVDEHVVASTLGRASCLLLPSAREGYGMVVVEAAAAGVPAIVVAGPDNAAVEHIEGGVNGFVVADAAPETLADAIVRVHAEGPALRERTAAWFAANVERLSVGTSLTEVLRAYRGQATGDA